jgi:hypothetical protein
MSPVSTQDKQMAKCGNSSASCNDLNTAFVNQNKDEKGEQ